MFVFLPAEAKTQRNGACSTSYILDSLACLYLKSCTFDFSLQLFIHDSFCLRSVFLLAFQNVINYSDTKD